MRVMQQISFGLCILLLGVMSGPSVASTTYKYDELGRLIRVEDSSGWATVYQYDQAGNRTQKVVALNPSNQPPLANDDSISATAGVGYEFDPRLNDSDPESGILTITVKTDGSQGTVTILNSGTELRYSANAGSSGLDSFTYTITDPQGASDTATVNVTIASPNSPPVAQDDSAAVMAGSSVIISVLSNDSDPDGDQLVLTSLTQGTKGTASLYINNTQIFYSANSVSSGTDSFTYTVSDGNGGQASATVTVNISQPPGGCGANPCP